MAQVKYFWETLLGIALAVWGWMMIRSVAHGERLASIESSMVKLPHLEAFATERRAAFKEFETENEKRFDELRASLTASIVHSVEQLRRDQRRMHLQNAQAIREGIAKIMEKRDQR